MNIKSKLGVVIILLLVSFRSVFAQVIDLSEKGTANSYIVSKGGKYKFIPAKGNGPKVTTINQVQGLWQAPKAVIGDITWDGKYISFSASEQKGNAVISAMDNKGEIIWSWHIWLTEDPAKKLHSAGEASVKMMDRNLGATTTNIEDVNSYGLYYQWGRKDPFIGALEVGDKSGDRREDVSFTTATAPVELGRRVTRFKPIGNDKINSNAIDFSIKNPTIFIGYVSEVDGSGVDTWFNTEFKLQDDLWGYDKRKQDNVKTIYDPCPVGFKVPGHSIKAWSQIEAAIPEGKLNSYVYMYDGEKTTYPASGSRRQTNGRIQYTGYNIYLWSAATFNEKAVGMRISEGKPHNNVKIPRAMGLPVRCICEDSIL
ncbi:hypothetical protein [Pseudopedobacter beijingensis]|uniref:WD40-like Beta Propeller Repeat n=1 Tax=Pseudopedobacter beijingensis TaxID=1207056 RepID=A0ABW4ICE2_9SPHI